ncbi:MAG: apolipoprotein N-acyltransferase, partial [Alphaproteobacteria bacterium]|nr:apolipoprotein N-acyltransferase [Alphaproteobacteria bacterium]
NFLPIQKVTSGLVDYSPGPGARSLSINGLPLVGPLICYEIIFPSEVVNPIQPPDWILNLTNDAWYGETAGPHQHLEITRIRAIERGVPVIRSANTGISAVIDPYGRVLDRLELNQSGSIDFYLPASIPERTLFHYVENKLFLIFVSLWIVALLMVFRRKRSYTAQ